MQSPIFSKTLKDNTGSNDKIMMRCSTGILGGFFVKSIKVKGLNVLLTNTEIDNIILDTDYICIRLKDNDKFYFKLSEEYQD